MPELERSIASRLRETYREAVALDPLTAPHAEDAFEVQEMLGEGGMGRVWAVRDRRMDRRAALKVLLRDDDPLARKRFLREARITSRLDHPAIPPVYEFGRNARGQLYLLMRLIEGQTLSERLNALERPQDREARRPELLRILIKVCEAIAYAHSQGVIHRDLKPSNIMVGRFGEVLVMDWGLARDAREAASDDLELLQSLRVEAPAELTQDGAILGTAGYMAPEQAGQGEVDARADIFALGSILCELLCGDCAVPGQSSLIRQVATLDRRIQRPRDVNRAVPRDLDAIAARATAPQPEGRYPRAEDLARELQAALDGAELESYRYSLVERARRLARRRPGAILGAASAIALLATSIGLGRELARASAQRAESEAALADAQRTEAAARDSVARAEADAARAAEGAARAKAALATLSEAESLIERGHASDEVIRLAVKALGLGDGAPELTLRAARIAIAAGEDRVAREWLVRLRDEHPPAYEALFELHQLELAAGAFRVTRPLLELVARAERRGDDNEFVRVVAAQEDLKSGDPKAALARLADLEASAPRFAFGYLTRALTLEALGRIPEALIDAQRAAELAPQRTDIALIRSRLLFANGQAAEANAMLTQARYMGQRDATALLSIASAFKAMGLFDSACQSASQAIALEPRLKVAYLVRGENHRLIGRFEEALADFAKALALDPSDTDARLCHNSLLEALGRGDEIEVTSEDLGPKLDAISTASPQQLLERGALERQQGDFNAALKTLNACIEAQPDNAAPYNERGLIRFEQGDLVGALADYDMTLRLNPKFVNAYSNRAQVAIKLESWKAALDDYTRFVKLEPRHPSAPAARQWINWLERKLAAER